MILIEDVKAICTVLEDCDKEGIEPEWDRYYYHRDRILVEILEEIGDDTDLLDCLKTIGNIVTTIGRT